MPCCFFIIHARAHVPGGVGSVTKSTFVFDMPLIIMKIGIPGNKRR